MCYRPVADCLADLLRRLARKRRPAVERDLHVLGFDLDRAAGAVELFGGEDAVRPRLPYHPRHVRRDRRVSAQQPMPPQLEQIAALDVGRAHGGYLIGVGLSWLGRAIRAEQRRQFLVRPEGREIEPRRLVGEQLRDVPLGEVRTSIIKNCQHPLLLWGEIPTANGNQFLTVGLDDADVLDTGLTSSLNDAVPRKY